MRRRALLILLTLVAVLVILMASVPLWLGFAVQQGARSYGLTFGSYERIGYSRFALRDVEYRRANVRVTIARAEAETPLLWWWHRWRGQPEVITAGDWRVEVSRSETLRAPAPDRGWMKLRGQLQRIADQLDRWLPRATVGAGMVSWPGGELAIASAKWSGRTLAAEDVAFRNLKADATLAFPGGDQLAVDARLDDGTATLNLSSHGPAAEGRLVVWEQPGTLTAQFDPQGWLPAEAVLQAESWNIPAERLKLGQAYATVRGNGKVAWQEQRIVCDIDVTGEPKPGTAAPPLQVTLAAHGDGRVFRIEALQAVLPGIEARLSEPVTVERSGRIEQTGAHFALTADLARVPWFTASGAVVGEARVVSSEAAAPVVEFSLEAREIQAHQVALAAATAGGRLEWPRIQISEGVIVSAEGDQLTWQGGWDFRAKELLETSITGRLRRASLARWLPPQPEFEFLDVTAAAAGPIKTVRHHGTLQAAGVKAPSLNPVAIDGKWEGQGVAVNAFELQAKAGGSTLVATGRGDAAGVTLNALDFRQQEATRLRLTSPAVVRWRPTLQIEALRLAGPDGAIDALATAGESGRIEIAARNVSGKWLTDFVPMPGPPWTLSLLALDGRWAGGPMTFTLTAGARVELGEGRTAAMNIAARGNPDGVQIEALRATEADATVINATGRVPVTFSPGGGELMRIDPDGALQLDATVAPNAAFWQKLAAISGVDLQDPAASARLTGTWRQPQGTASLRAARIAIDPKRITRPLPKIESLEVEVTGDRGGVSLRTFSVLVEGQPVRARGRLPVPEGTWDDFFKEPLAGARAGADIRVEVPDAEVAVFTRFLPAVLAPKGRLQADVQYKGGDIGGYLRLRDAASKPLGPLGVLQEINADIGMSGRKFILQGVTAKSGGQPVTLNGIVEVPSQGTPRFDLTLRGENLPFVRQTGLLIRGDLDLKLQTPDAAQPRLSGTVRLRDSLFLSDVRAFLPKGGASAARRPPYFAIETPPVNAWTLAVDVEGERFLRLRMPVFTGVASARFRLSGTLGEPRAIGEIEIDEGTIRMPFAGFAVTQGSVRLTESDPYQPAIYLRGTGRRYGYDLTMEIEGTAEQPNVVFTSSPPLDSEQVLLMVMTGAAPSNEIAKSATQRAASIGLFLGKSLLGSFGADSGDEDRLSVESGEKISRQGKETYDIAYKLTDRWTITGEYNEFDEYNAGVKWRAFGGRQPEETKANAKR